MAPAPTLAQKLRKNKAALKKRRTEYITKLLDSRVTEPKLMSDFVKSARRQKQSPLLRLPGELRVKILRNLLKTDKVIESKSEMQMQSYRRWSQTHVGPVDDEEIQRVETRYRRQTKLSSQVLRCCQALYADGRHILYQENKLSINLTKRRYGVLDLDLEIPQLTRQLDHPDQSIFSLATRHKSLHPFLTVYAVISEFGSLVVSMDQQEHQDLYADCRLFRELFHGKRLEISFPSWGPTIKLWLNACRILRCKEISFPGLHGDEVEKFCDLIKSDTDVVDHFEVVKACKEMIRVSWANRSGYLSASDDGANLAEAGMNYAAIETVDSEPKFSHVADTLITSMLAERRGVLEGKMRALKEEQDRINRSEVTMRAALHTAKKQPKDNT